MCTITSGLHFWLARFKEDPLSAELRVECGLRCAVWAGSKLPILSCCRPLSRVCECCIHSVWSYIEWMWSKMCCLSSEQVASFVLLHASVWVLYYSFSTECGLRCAVWAMRYVWASCQCPASVKGVWVLYSFSTECGLRCAVWAVRYVCLGKLPVLFLLPASFKGVWVFSTFHLEFI